MSFHHSTIRVCKTAEEMNEHLRFCQEFRRCFEGDYNSKLLLGTVNAYYSDKLVKFSLTYKTGKKNAATYLFSKCGGDIDNQEYVMEAWRNLNQYYKVPELDMAVWGSLSASPYRWSNGKYRGKRVKAWSYDVNSAYAAAMLGKMPDTSKEERVGYIQEGEIGFKLVPKFNEDGDMCVAQLEVGSYSNHIFPLMDSPFVGFVGKWYGLKKNAKTQEEKQKAKAMLVCAVGWLQRRNPALRATILTYANNFIRERMDENTLYVNTDCIVSLVPREDLDVGDGLGEFKLERDGEDFAYKGSGVCQWNKEKPKYPGIPKEWFDRYPNWDLLKDPPPECGNMYRFNPFTFQLEEIPEEESILYA